jgi:hypothetical protein
LYGYANNNPISWIDPAGTAPASNAVSNAFDYAAGFFDSLGGRYNVRSSSAAEAGQNAGVQWDHDISNFVSGAGDSFSLGAYQYERLMLQDDPKDYFIFLLPDGFALADYHSVWAALTDPDDGIDSTSSAYITGEWTETAIELLATLGSASLKKLAARQLEKLGAEAIGKVTSKKILKRIAKAAGNEAATKKIVRKLGKKAIRDQAEAQIKRVVPSALRRTDTQVHHLLPILGHPAMKGVPTAERSVALFPTAGLPAKIHSARILLRPGLDRAAHTAAHVNFFAKERLLRNAFNRYMIGARIGLNIRRRFDGK